MAYRYNRVSYPSRKNLSFPYYRLFWWNGCFLDDRHFSKCRTGVRSRSYFFIQPRICDRCVEVIFWKFDLHFCPNCPEVTLAETLRMSEQPPLQDGVRRGLGMLPQRAIFAKETVGDFVKMSKPVQVYTACQFGNKWAIFHWTSRQIGKKLPRAIFARSQFLRWLDLTSAQVEQKLILFSTSWRGFHFPTTCREVAL